jgi:acetyl-CoA synthetase
LVEILQDAVTLLFPVQRNNARDALMALKMWPLLVGFRGRPPGDVEALIDAVMAVANFAECHAHQLLELDVNPVLVMAQGQGVLAVDALIRIKGALNE